MEDEAIDQGKDVEIEDDKKVSDGQDVNILMDIQSKEIGWVMGLKKRNCNLNDSDGDDDGHGVT